MQVIEQFCEGKMGNPDLCEDILVITPDFIAVIDGATDKSGLKPDGKATGRFTAEHVAAAIRALPADTDARSAIDAITKTVRDALDVWRNCLGRPDMNAAAGVTMYSRAKKEIWRVADGRFLMDGVLNAGDIPVDRVYEDLRTLILTHAIAGGATEAELLANDPSRPLLMPFLQKQYLLENRDILYGYGTVNGTHIPDRYVEIFDASHARDIVITSDGYLTPAPTLAQSEKDLFAVLRDDPLLYKNVRSVKGWLQGQKSFDDRCYVRFTP